MVAVGKDTTQTEFNTVGKTGGAKTHLLSTAEMAQHTHTFTGSATGSAGGHTHGVPCWRYCWHRWSKSYRRMEWAVVEHMLK